MNSPHGAEIRRRQNLTSARRLQAAARSTAFRAKVASGVGATAGSLLAVIAPVVALRAPEWGSKVGAIAGAWIFVAELAVSPYARRQRRWAARAQEEFDVFVLGLEPSRALRGEGFAQEDVHSRSKNYRKSRYRNWYDIPPKATWPLSVLMCQRTNAVWGRRLHRWYSALLSAAAVALASIGVWSGIAQGISLAIYLGTVLLPQLPFLLSVSRLGVAHFKASLVRGRIEAMVDGADSTNSLEMPYLLRSIQDELLRARAFFPPVPSWLHRVMKRHLSRATRYANQRLTARMPN